MSIAHTHGARNRALIGLLLTLVASAVAIAARPSPASALPVVHVVDPNGNDAGPGTDAQPWRSLQGALDRLSPGTVLLVRNGDYRGPFFIRTKATANAPVMVAAYPGHQPILRSGEWQALGVHDASHVYVRGFEVIGDAGTARRREVGLESARSHHVYFQSNIVHDMGGGGINVVESNHVSVSYNMVYRTSFWGENQMSAISFWRMSNIGGPNNADGFSNYINGNYVFENENRVGELSDGNCIIIDSNDEVGYTASTLISLNICRANGGAGIHVFRSSNAAVINNTVFDNRRNVRGDGGELSAIYASNVLFRNNLVAPGRPGGGIHVYSARNVISDHNAYVDSRASFLGPSDKLVPGLPMMFGIFPPGDGPTVNAGNPAGAPAGDYLGSPRRGAPDIGAFELN